MMQAFLKALRLEMDYYKEDFSYFDTIYIGGGTPSLLALSDLASLLEVITRSFTIAADAEITLEANPADLDRTQLEDMRHLGINRLNLGIQSFDNRLLRFLGRRHDRKEAMLAIEAAQEAGFENLGLDLIYGAPHQDLASWEETLHQALSFHAAHLSCYQLTLEPETPLALRHRQGEISLPGEERQADFYFNTVSILVGAGYHHYEVSNFSRKETSFARHNQKYWRHTPYLGLGPSAHSFQGNRRWWNYRDLAAYLHNLEGGQPPRAAVEKLLPKQLRLETLFLGLRTSRGIDLDDFLERFGYDLLAEKAEAIADFEKRGLLEIKSGFLRPTSAGMAVADTLALM